MATRENVYEIQAKLRVKQLDFDALYEFITTRDTNKRLSIILGLEKFYREQYALEIANVQHNEFSECINWLFDYMKDFSNPCARSVQTGFVFFSIASEPRFKEFLCPLPPSDERAIDWSRCDRTAFVHLEQYLGSHYISALLHNKIETFDSFVDGLVTLYVALLPADPMRCIGRPTNKRKRPADV